MAKISVGNTSPVVTATVNDGDTTIGVVNGSGSIASVAGDTVTTVQVGVANVKVSVNGQAATVATDNSSPIINAVASSKTIVAVNGYVPEVSGNAAQTAQWGGITGTLGTQSDLVAALAGKQNLDGTLTALAGLVWGAGTQVLTLTGPDSITLKTVGTAGGNILDKASADALYQATFGAGTTGQYLRGDQSWQTLDKTAVGLTNVDNTSDVNKPVSTATQTALNAKADTSSLSGYATTTALAGKEPTITAGSTSQYWRGDKSWQTLNASAVGLGNVSNVAQQPLNAQLTALAGVTWTSGTQVLTLTASGTVSLKTVGAGTGNILDKGSADTLYQAIGSYEGAITAGSTTQYWRGDKSWQTLDKTAVGLGNVDNTSDVNKPVSTATQTALDGKLTWIDNTTAYGPNAVRIPGTYSAISAGDITTTSMATINSGSSTANNGAGISIDLQNFAGGGWMGGLTANSRFQIQTYGTVTGWEFNTAPYVGTNVIYHAGNLTKTTLGLGNVDNTSDTSKPVSTAQQTALDLKANLTGASFSGAVSASNLSGTNTGDQTISITGDVTAAGNTGALTATVTKINGTSLAALGTGILKNTTATGVPSIAVASDFPILNQNTTGSAAKLAVGRNFLITGGGITASAISFDGSANVSLNASVDAGHITLARMAGLSANTIIGNNTGSVATPLALTGANVTAMLSPVVAGGAQGVMIGSDKTKLDAISGTNTGDETYSTITTKLASGSGGGTTNFLRADGTFAPPPGGSGSGTVTSVSVTTANGVSGSVATSTTTPAITLTLGAITPTSVASTGTVTGTNLSGTNTGDQTITLTGDVTGTGTGSFATAIGSNKVTRGMLAATSGAAILGATAAGNVTDLTGTQATALLSTVVAGGAQGVMTGTDKTKLDGIATGATANTGTVTAVSVAAANGLSGTSSGGATPALTLTLGAITPSSVAATGTVTGSNLSGTNTGDETSTTVVSKIASQAIAPASVAASGTVTGSNIVQGFGIGVSGKSTASARYPTKAPYAFTATTSSSATALVAATASTVYTVKKGTVASPTTVGTFTFAAAGTVATVSITAGSISSGDVVWIEAPGTADTTLADITFTVRA